MKNRIINQLKKNMGNFVSGEALSQELGVTRAAIWKYIKEIKEDGYPLEASPRKGYRLLSIPDILNEAEIGEGLQTNIIGKDIRYFKDIDSTNKYAKQIALEGCPNGTVVVAECQTEGRGRLGRYWSSAASKGIWLSVVLRPEVLPSDVQVITLAAAVAVVEAIKTATGIGTGIKWPNDIVLQGKKVCGILSEISAEVDRINFLVLGIGINVNQNCDDFEESLRDKATSLKIFARENGIRPVNADGEGSYLRSVIVKEMLRNLERMYNDINAGNTEEIINAWRKYSVTLGREVKVSYRNREYTGTALDITNDGKLLVKCSDGEMLELQSGEVSVRGIMGYV